MRTLSYMSSRIGVSEVGNAKSIEISSSIGFFEIGNAKILVCVQ